MIEKKLPKFSAALAAIIKDSHVPEQTWKLIDKELTQKLLRAAAGSARPTGTNRYQSVAAKRNMPS